MYTHIKKPYELAYTMHTCNFESLPTSQHGLSSKKPEEMLQQFGRNELQEGEKRTIAAMLLAQFKDVMILILLAAS